MVDECNRLISPTVHRALRLECDSGLPMPFSNRALRLLAGSTLLLSLLELHSTFGWGQGSSTLGVANITTIVFDPAGAGIPNAEVTFKGARTVTTKTEQNGYVQVPLPYGTYTVTTSSPGFQTDEIIGFSVDTVKPPVLNIVLQIMPTPCNPCVPVEGAAQTVTSDLPSVVAPRAIKDEIQLRAKLKAIVPLEDFSGKAFPVDIDPHFALTVLIVSAMPAVADFTPGSVVTFAIHSPTTVFAGNAIKRKTYNFSMCREAGDDKVQFSRFGIQINHGVRLGGCG